ncbi:unnamed protein product [Dovyalis caffra]|uniref:Uncharacterized protein n=1 Tax=Dovyalis caffra TaxID=77055 RepID=A0AAV1SEG5_9ROSI|nr:unnamed protein product [Dovyalis caffra]
MGLFLRNLKPICLELIWAMAMTPGGVDVAMVSIRRRKLIGRPTGRSSSSAPLPSIPDGRVPKYPEHGGKPVNARHIPSVALNQPVEVKEGKATITNPPAKKPKLHVQIDPENPMEVHAYLMQLKEDNKLEPGPMQRSEKMPVKELMEKCYPHIFRVFPQDPKVIFEFPNKSEQNEFLYCQYWLFLFEVRDIVSIDKSVPPEHVESLVKVIKNLEKQGFDCRFLRSELVVVGYKMKKQLEITLAEKSVISTRAINLERELQAAARRKDKEAELDMKGNQLEGMTPEIETQSKRQQDQYNRLGEMNKLPCAALEQEFVQVILEHHKKLLECKEEEERRLGRILEKINQLL